MPRRTLSLRRETLAELAPADLASVAGGVLTPGATCVLEYGRNTYVVCWTQAQGATRCVCETETR